MNRRDSKRWWCFLVAKSVTGQVRWQVTGKYPTFSSCNVDIVCFSDERYCQGLNRSTKHRDESDDTNQPTRDGRAKHNGFLRLFEH